MAHPSTRSRLRLPGWTAHPGFGVLALFVLAVVLIWRGEPQPSSRPSGTSVAVSGTSSAPSGTLRPLLVIKGSKLEYVQRDVVRVVALPPGAEPRALLTNRGLSVVLALIDGRQRAFAVTAKLVVVDLGYADAVLPSVRGSAAVIVESALTDPGTVPLPSPTATPVSTALTGSSSESSKPPSQPALRDFGIRRFDADGNAIQPISPLPSGFRAAVDTPVGLTVWQPVNRVFDQGVEQESLSAAARLIRPDGTERLLGPVHPLASTSSELLVWDVAVRRFGVMPLRYATSTATSTASPSQKSSAARTTSSASASASASASPSATTVAGTRWFLPTRGMLLVTGPAAFNADGSAFAVYAQVGSRRRLVVAQLKDLGTDQVEVLVLAQPPAKTAASSPSGSLIRPSPSGRSSSASPSPTPSLPVVASDGYPVSAPLTPIWWNDTVVAVALDSTVIGYRPGSALSSELDLGLDDVKALAPAP